MNSEIEKEIDSLKRTIRWEQINNQCLYEIIMLSDKMSEIKAFFSKQGIDSIAVYGLGRVGKAFVNLMKKSGVRVAYCLDRNKSISLEGVEVRHSLENATGDIDMMVVTVELDFDKIKAEMKLDDSVSVVTVRDLMEAILLIPEKIDL